MPSKTIINNSSSGNGNRGNSSNNSSRSSGKRSRSLAHSAVHKPVPGKGGKGGSSKLWTK